MRKTAFLIDQLIYTILLLEVDNDDYHQNNNIDDS